MQKFILLLFVTMCLFDLSGQTRGMGLNFKKSDLASMPKRTSAMKFRGVLPSSIDLTNYCPDIGNQGETGTCLAWSTAYYSRTMLYAITNNVTNKSEITKHAFSPSYLFEKIRHPEDIACLNGSNFQDAYDVLLNYGVPLYADLPFPACNRDVTGFDSKATNFKIKDYQIITDDYLSVDENINRLKEALSLKLPVQIGVSMVQSISLLDSDGIWKPDPGETCSRCGHAMTIIGYDDNVNGGSFRIVNSWSEDWGDKGMAWVNYKDLMNILLVAGQMIPYTDKPKPMQDYLNATVDLMVGKTAPEKVPFQSRFSHFRNLVTIEDEPEPSPVDRNLIKRFVGDKEYKSGDAFKLKVSVSNSAYVYVIASDDQNSSINLLFPSKVKGSIESTLIPAGLEVILPGPKSSFKMDDTAGNDFFIALISENEINIDDLIAKIKSKEGDFYTRVLNTIGNQLIPANEINWKNNTPSFSISKKHNNSIVPILIELKHNVN